MILYRKKELKLINMAKVKLPDGKVLEVDNSLTGKQLAEKIGPGLAKSAIAAKINGQLKDLSAPIFSNGSARS